MLASFIDRPFLDNHAFVPGTVELSAERLVAIGQIRPRVWVPRRLRTDQELRMAAAVPHRGLKSRLGRKVADRVAEDPRVSLKLFYDLGEMFTSTNRSTHNDSHA